MKKKSVEIDRDQSFLSKMIRIMKLTTIFLLVTLLQVSASVYSQNTLLNLQMKNASLKLVLQEIERQSEFTFLYNDTKVSVDKKVTINCEGKKVEEILNKVLLDTGISYEVIDKQIVLTQNAVNTNANFLSEQTQQPKARIIGKVIDSNNSPLPGVSVVVSGTTNGTITDNDGNYALDYATGDKSLTFSFIGMESQVLPIGSKTEINIRMIESTIGLQEVVAIGYGTQKKVNLTGAISTVKFDDELENRPITNATQALSGKVSGVWVSQNSGKPGSDGAQIRVRGWGTMNNSNPLVIIDGVEGSFDQLNPNDIENMSVLKDAASAAIYGSKAANGVILITTKQGKKNEKIQINLSSYYGVQSLGKRYDLINNSAEHMEFTNKALTNAGSSPLFPDYMISDFKTGTDKYKYPNTDWYKVLFTTAPIQEHNVSIRGGSAQTSSFLSFNYLNQDGIVANTNSERFGIRANVESNINDFIILSGRINYSRKISKEPYADITYGSLGRVFEMLSGATPYIAPYTRDGRYGSVEAIDKDGNLLYDNRNPLIDAANGKTTTEENFVSANVSLEIKFTDYLQWKSTIASTANWNIIDKYNQSVFGYTDTGVETITKNYNREGLEMNRNGVSLIDNNLFTTLNFNKQFNQIHSISAIAGMQLESTVIKNLYARRTNPPKEGLTQIDAGTSGIQGEGNLKGLKLFSYFGRVNYSLSDKYLFEANLRADASSRFKKRSRWGIFPGFSLGWRLSEEQFIKDMNYFSNLKLRASWGQLGNQNITGYWPYLTVINQDNSLSYSSGGSFRPGAAVTSLIDQNITWETTSSLDIGLDLGFGDNRINIEADYFNKNTSDIIVQLPIPLIMGGLSAPYENVGEMKNTGFEFVINYDNKQLNRNRLGYNLGANITYINNEVTKFRGGNSPDQLYLIREGYSYRSLYGYKAIGIYQTDAEALEHMYDNSLKPKAGNLKFEDVNKDGKLGFEDKQGLGNTIPKITYGISSSFKFKGFDFGLLFQGIAGVNAYTQNNFTNISWENRAISKRWRDAWTPENSTSNIPSIKFNDTWDNSESSFWVHNISFLKLKNIQLGYSFSNNVISRLKLQKLYVFANAQNVFTLVNNDYEGYDPERNTFDSGNNLYPVPRIISLGLNLNF